VFAIVEGPSDAQALEVLLNQIYDKNSVYLEITHGDATTMKCADSSPIISMLIWNRGLSLGTKNIHLNVIQIWGSALR
jgi:hypothetical protein